MLKFNKLSYSLGAISLGSLLSGSIAQRSFCTGNFTIDQKPEIILYQYKICPFCNRVKALLEYSNLPFKSVEVNPLTKSEISFSKDHKKVPIAKINGEVVVDSANIINAVKEIIEKNQQNAPLLKDLFQEDT